MKVIIDANILISAILKDRTPEKVILFIIESNQLEWLVSSFLACAIAGSANFFITGDKDFSEAQKIVDTVIISANDFERIVCQGILKG